MIQNIVDTCYQIKTLAASQDTKTLRDMISQQYSDGFFQSLRRELTSNKELYIELFDAFDERQSADLDTRSDLGLSKQVVADLITQGVTQVSGLIPEELLNLSIETLDRIYKSVPEKERTVSGRIVPISATSVRHQPSLPNDGQVRVQSKSWGGHLPGALEISNLKSLVDVFSGYCGLQKCEISRSTSEWIHPSKLNHNGWHRDMVVHRLKAMVLLEDCDYDSAPFLYAKKSHRTTTEFDKQHLFDRFCLPGSSKQGNKASWASGRTEWPNYALANPTKHCGYVGGEFAPNDLTIEQRKQKTVTIGGYEYELLVGTGKAGDVIFFESCGLHSGSKAINNTRRNISFSGYKHLSPKNVFFNMIQNLV